MTTLPLKALTVPVLRVFDEFRLVILTKTKMNLKRQCYFDGDNPIAVGK